MPQPMLLLLVVVVPVTSPLAAIHSHCTLRVLSTALPLVAMIVGDTTPPPHLMVVLARPRLLPLGLDGRTLTSSLDWP